MNRRQRVALRHPRARLGGNDKSDRWINGVFHVAEPAAKGYDAVANLARLDPLDDARRPGEEVGLARRLWQPAWTVDCRAVSTLRAHDLLEFFQRAATCHCLDHHRRRVP